MALVLDFPIDIPPEYLDRRSPDRVIREWMTRYQAECPRADDACTCVATETEILDALGGDDPDEVIRQYARSVAPSSGESGDHGPAGAQ